MKYVGSITKGLLSVSAVSLITAQAAFAGGTAAGTNVQNTFTLDYQVAGVSQPQLDTGSGGTNTPTEFTVDRLIDLTVASNGDTTVAPGAQDQEMSFSVTNNGNDTQAYSFALANESGDTFDTTGMNIKYYVDDGDGVFQTDGTDGAGTAYTAGSGSASPDVAADKIVWIVVDGDIPSALNDANTSEVSLIADTLDPTTGASPGTAVTADSGGNSLTGAAENVLADGSGTGNEVANAGDHSATGTYIVASADLTGSKAVSIFTEDGTGCSSIPGTAGSGDQYSIPGACVQYVITVANTGSSATATDIAVADVLPDELTYIAAAVSGFTGGSLTEPAANTDCDSSACTVSFSGGSLSASSSATLTIRALVK